MIALITIYGSFAALALWSAWRDPDLRYVGMMLAFSFGISNVSFFTLSMAERPATYTVTEIAVALTAYFARIAGAPRAMTFVVMIAAISCAANIAISVQLAPNRAQINAWEIVTNMCYVAECLLTIGTGVAMRVQSGGFARWPDRDRHAPQSAACDTDNTR